MKLNKVLKLGVAPLCATALLACGPYGKNKKITVTFKDADGAILQSSTIKSGEDAVYETPTLPYKEPTGTVYANKFIGWDKPLTKIKENTTFTPKFMELDRANYEDNDCDGIPAGIDPDDNDNEFTYGAKSMVYLENQSIKIDFSKFIRTKDAIPNYDNDIAKLGLLMSNPKADFNDGLFDIKSYGSRENALYSRLGCDEWYHFDFKDEAANTYKYDPNDTTSGVYGHKYIVNEYGMGRDLIFIAFEGTNGPRRWASNFDVGYDDLSEESSTTYDKSYYEMAKRGGETGTRADHPEWTDRRFHKGFYVAASRVLNERVDGNTKLGPVQFKKYIEKYLNTSPGNEPIVFVTGHSRGGAMATIVGDYLENEYEHKDRIIPLTYAYAAPSVWGTNSSRNVNTIFNVINNDDLVTKVPFTGWGFSKLSKTTISESASKYKILYDRNRDKREYQNIDPTIQESIFANLKCNGRNNIYNFDYVLGETSKPYISDIALNERTHYTQESANAELEELKTTYREMLGDFFNYIELVVSGPEGILSNKYNIYANACLGTVTALVQKLMVNDEKVMSHITDILPLISNGYFLEMALSLVVQIFPEGPDKIALPHDYGAYTILLNNYTPTPPQP